MTCTAVSNPNPTTGFKILCAATGDWADFRCLLSAFPLCDSNDIGMLLIRSVDKTCDVLLNVPKKISPISARKIGLNFIFG